MRYNSVANIIGLSSFV